MNIVTHGFHATDTAVAIGNFDGVHLGHQLLLDTLLSESSLLPVVFTFAPHPFPILTGRDMPLLTTTAEKIALLESFGISTVYLAKSTPSLLQTEAKDFVKNYLVDALGARHIVVGSDFRFGHKGLGTGKLLSEMGRELGFCVTCIEKLRIDDTEVSSSTIRNAVSMGAIERANALLGHAYNITGAVQRGRHVGTALGAPTINIALPQNKILPPTGVYATETLIDKKSYPSVSFIGTSPTYQTDVPLVETHIIDFNQDIYGQHVTISFHHYLRKTLHFDSEAALMTQILLDIQQAKESYHG